jgi:hypothetical protein
MATYDWGFDKSFKAAVDLSASQYYFVKAGSVAGEVTINNVSAGSVLGVLQNKPKATEAANVRMLGTSKVRANSEATASPLTYGGFVKSGSDGMAIGYTNSTASQFAAGIMLDTAYTTGCGAYVEIFLLPSYVRA